MLTHQRVMRDVTEGGNRGCGTPGFKAVEGWDPGKSITQISSSAVETYNILMFSFLATGLGTPIYPKMLDLFMSLP